MIEEADVVMGTLIFFAVFAAVKVSYFVPHILFAECTDEFRDVRWSERVIRRYIVSVFILGGVAFVGVSIRKSSPRIAVVIEVQIGLVDDSNRPHDAVIDAATKALTASHFQCLRSACFIEGKSTGGGVLIAF